ncbi:MAG TPA: glycosyltransferase, partial [Puia sp.]|nr:glycosyltransferase [Puia sp.]
SPLLKELAKKTDLMVYYFSDASITGTIDKGFSQEVKWDTPLVEGYEYFFLKNYSRGKSLDNNLFDVFNPGVIKILWKEKATFIIVNGWSYSSNVMTILFAKLFGKKVWLRAENPLNQELQKSKKTIFVKKIFLKHFLFRFFIHKFLYIGKENKLFFQYYGVSSARLIYTPYAVDNNFFEMQHDNLKNSHIQLKTDLGLSMERKIILFSGKFIEKKRPLDLLQAFSLLERDKYSLVMVGDGELRKKMEDYIEQMSLSEVYLTGFINQSAISQYYEIADVFVMCSGLGETWGLSVNEIMNFEKPVLISRICGCSGDLVDEGNNGYTFDEGNIKQLSQLLADVLENDSFLISAGKRSKKIIENYSISKITDNLVAALQ